MSLSCREDRMMICGIVLRQYRNVTDVMLMPYSHEVRYGNWKTAALYCIRTFSSGLHAAGDVDRITKETVPRHRNSNHSADHRSTVQAAADHHLAIWTMSNLCTAKVITRTKPAYKIIMMSPNTDTSNIN